MDISREMTRLPLAGYTLHQEKDYRLTFTGWSDEDIASGVGKALQRLFTEGILAEISVQPVQQMTKQKLVTYSSAFELKG